MGHADNVRTVIVQMDKVERGRLEPVAHAWSSLVEGHEQPDRPNSQTYMECCHACAAYFFILS